MIEVEAGGRVPFAGRIERFPFCTERRGFRSREAVGTVVGGDVFAMTLWEGSVEAAQRYNS